MTTNALQRSRDGPWTAADARRRAERPAATAERGRDERANGERQRPDPEGGAAPRRGLLVCSITPRANLGSFAFCRRVGPLVARAVALVSIELHKLDPARRGSNTTRRNEDEN